MQIKHASAIIVLALSLIFASCAKTPPIGGADTLTVAVTTDALFELAAYIGGERVTVVKLIPDGVELHDFEPRAKDIVSLGSADVLIINGLGLEPWIGGAVSASGNDTLVTVDASRGVSPIAAADHGDEHDPHIWLSLKCAAAMAEAIRDVLCQADPGGADSYRDSCDGFTAQLDALYREYEAVFSNADNRTLVTAHAVFAYLCRDFGLTQVSIEGVFAEGEPSPQRLAELSDYCVENGITTVFAETGSSAQLAETLAREAGAEVVTVYTLESAEDGLTYLERMEYNLAAIAAAVNR